MKCKTCGRCEDSHNDRNPWNDCKQFISSNETKMSPDSKF